VCCTGGGTCNEPVTPVSPVLLIRPYGAHPITHYSKIKPVVARIKIETFSELICTSLARI
jgi:hypothetical protein